MWRFDYDRAGRLVAETDYNDAHTRYEVDVAGRAVARIDALGRRTDTTFDAAGRVVASVSDTDGRTEFRFNEAGELVEAANADAVVTYHRDPDTGVVVGETINGITTGWNADPRSRSATRTVDTTTAATTANGGVGGRWVTDFGWDQAGCQRRLKSDPLSTFEF